jgi:4-hydroxy-3-methylbut-2-enyl diphosphate reductase
MRIILASPRGFCAGVNMAIKSLETALARFGVPVYVFHEIVHNKWVVNHFRRQGVVFVDRIDDVPPESYLLYSAHGVSPEIRRQAAERRLKTIDATCPLVTKIHREAVELSQQGYTVLLIGHAGHDEVVGTLGEAPEAIRLVGNPEEIDRIEAPNPDRVAYLTQTTLSVDDAARAIARLRRRFPKIVGPTHEDVCYATQNRQEAVRKVARRADVVLVVGSQNSSNTQRLREIACDAGAPVHLIDEAGEIDPAWFRADATVAITAGASAPEHLVQGCVAWLKERFEATVHDEGTVRETVRFPLPAELRHNPPDEQGRAADRPRE